MKGCPLRCRWCHNPEGLSRELQLQFFADKCISCGSCGKREKLSDAKSCPAEALKVCGEEMGDTEVLREILKDRIFYSNNGGVTFSGGECLLQADFVASVIALAKAEGLHTAIDTCGYVSWDRIEKTLQYCDLYLYDVKCIDPLVHKKYTGVDNALIIENLKRLSALNKDIWVRVPVIPDFNDNEKEMTAIAELVSSLTSVKQVTLMPYHTLGASKYETLGLEYQFDSTKRITEEQLGSFREIFKKRQIELS